MKRTFLLFTAMGMALVLSSAIALAATFTSTAADETLTGTKKSDTFVFDDGWGEDTVVDPKGKDDTLDFSAVETNLSILLCPDLTDDSGTNGEATDGDNTVGFDSAIENAVGGSDSDQVLGCGLKNELDGGSGDVSDNLYDYGGISNIEQSITPTELPATSDAYTGFTTTSGVDVIFDFGGKKDSAEFGFETGDVQFFKADLIPQVPGDESLIVQDDPENPTFGVVIGNYFGEETDVGSYTIGPGEIEKLKFDDRSLNRKKVEALVQPLPEATAAGLSSSKASSANDLPGLLGDLL